MHCATKIHALLLHQKQLPLVTVSKIRVPLTAHKAGKNLHRCSATAARAAVDARLSLSLGATYPPRGPEVRAATRTPATKHHRVGANRALHFSTPAHWSSRQQPGSSSSSTVRCGGYADGLSFLCRQGLRTTNQRLLKNWERFRKGLRKECHNHGTPKDLGQRHNVHTLTRFLSN